jgi:hypothetical protein
MKSLIMASCMLFAFTAHSQLKTYTVRIFNSTTGKVENLVMTIQDNTPKPYDYKVVLDPYSNTKPINSTPAKSLSEQWGKPVMPAGYVPSTYTVTPYSQTAEYKGAQDAMKMLDAIIATPKKN